MGVEPLRDCCVNAYGLFDPEWLFISNLSGTAGEVFIALVSKNISFGTSAVFCPG